jgi:cobaltochelatase CobS
MLSCKICSFKSGNLEPHIVNTHFRDAGLMAQPEGEKRDIATLSWYCEQFDATENDIVHPSLLTKSEEVPVKTKKAKAAAPVSDPALWFQFGNLEQKITSTSIKVEMAIRAGDSTLVPKLNPAYHFPETVKDVVLDINENKRVLLVGHTGTGKTSLVEQIAARTNRKVIRVNMNGQTTIGDFVGLWTVKGGETVWVDGVLPMAMREGYWLIVDELSCAEASILSVLQAVLEPNGKLMLKEKGHELIEPHPEFRLFATDNAAGCMQDYRALYQGTNLMHEAFLDRWRMYQIGYLPSNVEEAALLGTVNKLTATVAKSIVLVANQVRKAFIEEQVQCTFSFRRMVEWAELMVRHRDPVAAAQASIFSKINPQDAEVIKGLIERNMTGKRS